MSFIFRDALSTASTFVSCSTALCVAAQSGTGGWIQAPGDQDRCGSASMWHPGTNPTVLHWKCPLSISAYGLPESLSLGENLSKDEAIFDLVFTFMVKIKRYMKHKLGILCLVLDPLTPPISLGCQASG